jgi:putative acetyltransferase
MIIRAEEPADANAIRKVEEAAFPTSAEADLVDRLRSDHDAAFSLVAVEGDELVGHALFSRMEAPFRALGLGPVAVLSSRQGIGIGTRLITAGLACARAEGWQGVFVLGEPAYYRRFGFDAGRAAGFTSPYAGPYLMALALQADDLPVRSGSIAYAPAFAGLGQEQ